MKSTLKHILHYGGLYVFLLLIYYAVMWRAPEAIFTRIEHPVALTHGVVAVTIWIVYGLNKLEQ